MRNRKRYNQIAIIISFIAILLLVCYSFYSKWQKEKNIFVYEEHLNDIVVTVGEQPVTLREFGYYIVKMEKDVQEKALIYNPKDPMEYWNVHFSAGLDSGYMFEYAWNYALADCVCDLIFAQKAKKKDIAYLKMDVNGQKYNQKNYIQCLQQSKLKKRV